MDERRCYPCDDQLTTESDDWCLVSPRPPLRSPLWEVEGGVHPRNNYDQHQTGVTWWYNHAHIIPGGVLYTYRQGTSVSILCEKDLAALLVFCFLTLRCVMSVGLIPHNGSVLSQFCCLTFSKWPPITGLSVSRAPFTRYLRKLMIDSHQFETLLFLSVAP